MCTSLRTASLRCALVCALAPLTTAQSDGPVIGLPHGFSIDPGTTIPGGGAEKLLFSNAGFDGYRPPPPPPGFVIPDFTTYLGGAAVDVDALSLGLDWIVATPAGEAVVGPDQWAAITVSVTPTTSGKPGTLIRDETLAPDGAAADVIAYVIPGSALPPAIVGVPLRAQDGAELDPLFATTPGNVDAHDVYVSLIYLENPQIAALLPPPTVFFSVSETSAAAIPAAWTTLPSERTGATVFATTWIPGAMSWTTPVVAFTGSDLGLDPGEDVDGFAYDVLRGLVLFSTDILLPPISGPRDPLLFHVVGSGIHVPYTLPGGPTLSDELGLDLAPDDIDGICSLDPGSAAQPSPINLPFLLGTPQPPLPLGTQNTLSAAAYRKFDPVNLQEFATTWMTGWPPPGTPQPGLAVSAGAIGNPAGPYVVLDVFVRPQPTNNFEGHPHRTALQIPPTLHLSGQQLFFVWGALTASTFETSLPVGLRL